jgi:hypothetical protein
MFVIKIAPIITAKLYKIKDRRKRYAISLSKSDFSSATELCTNSFQSCVYLFSFSLYIKNQMLYFVVGKCVLCNVKIVK